MSATIASVVADAIADLTALGTSHATCSITSRGVTVQISAYGLDDEEVLNRWDRVLNLLGGDWARNATPYPGKAEGTVEANAMRNGVAWRVWAPMNDHANGVLAVEGVPAHV